MDKREADVIIEWIYRNSLNGTIGKGHAKKFADFIKSLVCEGEGGIYAAVCEVINDNNYIPGHPEVTVVISSEAWNEFYNYWFSNCDTEPDNED